ncbi:hypothetical protein [Acutalibacter sp. 1XD8-33]|uniref:hypothetical protein n=1 Tax=Acutalibacter sp. 1XD8-33 TaxID=2320081 RepID=UPI0013144212|nr:hypothetical protein [Acutalibacter sp. 1XD8-33]
MRRKLFWGQIAALSVTIVSVIVLGVLILTRHGLENLALVYVFAGLGIAGFWANAGLAVARVLWERNGRK